MSCAPVDFTAPAPSESANDTAESICPRPTIAVGIDIDRVTDEAIAALARDPRVYQRGGRLVHIVREPSLKSSISRPAHTPRVVPISMPLLREMLAKSARWVRERMDRGGNLVEVEIVPPDAIVHGVLARGEWPGIRPLVALLEAPALRPDGTIIQRAGYDAATGRLYEPNADYPEIAESPTREDARRAIADLLEVFADFPFASGANRSAMLAALLTTFARSAIDGPTPLNAIDASLRGTGKSLSVDAIHLIHSGRPAPRMPHSPKDDETRKALGAIAIEGDAIVLIDNVEQPLGCPALDAVLTSTTWKDRELGKSATLSAPWITVLFATGNNLAFVGDLSRRTLVVRFESREENPEARTGFTHPNLRAWVLAERPRLVAAALTVLRGYFAAGRPRVKVQAWGSYESWSAIIASALVWAGEADPTLSRVEIDAGDPTKLALKTLLLGWRRLTAETPQGVTAKAAINALFPTRAESGPPDGYDDVREAIETLTKSVPGKAPSAAQLGYTLRKNRRRVIDGLMLDGEVDRSGIVHWRVVTAGRGIQGMRGDQITPPYETDQKLSRSGSENITRHAPYPPRQGAA